jgi:hypothetical protein
MAQSVYFVLLHSLQIGSGAYKAVLFPWRLSGRVVKLATHLL